jgi:hypothetical protein
MQIDTRQAPGSPGQWPTDEPYSVIASKELGLCVTMLGKKHPSTLTSINNPAAALKDQGKYRQVREMYLQALSQSEDLKTKPSMRRELGPPGVNLQ